jgi:hypothetical protein
MTSGSSGVGGGIDLDAPPASPAVVVGVFDGIAAVGSAVAVDGATAAGPSTGAWEPDGAALVAAGGVGSPALFPAYARYWGPDLPVGATSEAEGEEALMSKGWVNTH